MTRYLKSFFFGPTGTGYDKFSTENIPTELRYRQLFDSVLWPAQVGDTAKVTEAGHVKLGGDANVFLRNDGDADGHRRVVEPHQLPALWVVAGPPLHTLGVPSSANGITLTPMRYDYPAPSTEYRLDYLFACNVSKSIVIDTTALALDGDVLAPGNNYFYGTDGSGTKGWYDLSTISIVDELVKVGVGGTAGYLSAAFFTYNALGIYISDSAITETQLNVSVAGDALVGGGGAALDVQADEATIHVDAVNDWIEVMDDGIGPDQIDASVLCVAGGLQQEVTGCISILPDVTNGTSMVTSSDGLRLEGDANAPAGDYYYGTDAGGAKGWHALASVSGLITINNNVDNYVLTATGIANTINGEINMQFNGTVLELAADIMFSSGADRDIYMESGAGAGSHLSILGADAGGMGNAGGNIYMAAGSPTGVGAMGCLYLGFDGAAAQGSINFGYAATTPMGWWGATPIARDTNVWTVSNHLTDYSYNADSTSEDELADVLGTLITLLKSYGILA